MTDVIGHVPMLTSALFVFMHTARAHVSGNTSIQTVKIDGPLSYGACLPRLSLELSEIENGSRSLIDCSSNGRLRWKKITPSSKEATRAGCPRKWIGCSQQEHEKSYTLRTLGISKVKAKEIKTDLLGREQPKTPQSHLFKAQYPSLPVR